MKYSKEQLAEVLRLHGLWINRSDGGVKADLSLANLSGADLSWANLSGVDLSEANLSGADLSGADLSGADLSWDNLSGVNLSGANLSGVNLSGANLSGADLSWANLSGVDLSRANLSEAELFRATIDPIAERRLSIVPESGSFEGWKKCKDGVLVRLRILSASRRSNSTGRKCRAERVKVLEVVGAEFGVSIYDNTTEYRVGRTVHCDHWNENRWQECGGGIHFYLTRAEAEVHE